MVNLLEQQRESEMLANSFGPTLFHGVYVEQTLQF